MKEDIKAEKAEAFALRIIKLHRYLTTDKKEWSMSTQILRSGTAIGANIAESEYAESKQDFIHKLGIAQKECAETLYWIRLLGKSEYVSKELYNSLYADCEELLRIITSVIRTSKSIT